MEGLLRGGAAEMHRSLDVSTDRDRYGVHKTSEDRRLESI